MLEVVYAYFSLWCVRISVIYVFAMVISVTASVHIGQSQLSSASASAIVSLTGAASADVLE